MIHIAKPSCQSLFIQMQFNGQALSTGTGFIADSPSGPVLITNRHNVTGRHQETGIPLSTHGGTPNEIVIIHNVKNQLGVWVPKVEALYDSNDNPIWVEHPTLGRRADFVALRLTNLEEVELYPYSLGVGDPEIQFGVTDIVSVVGFPFGIRGGGSLAVWATGFVATEPAIDYEQLPVFLIDCRSRPGQSGSAVISYRAGGMVAMQDGSSAIFSGPATRFHGIYSGRINNQSDLGIVWKATALQELVSTIKK